MANKSIYQILEGQEALLNSVISSLDLNETSSRTVRPLLEYLKQDIKAHLQDLQGSSTMIPIQEDSKNVALLSLQEGIRQRIVVEQAQWDRIDQMDKRLSKLEEQVYPKRNIFQERP